MTWGTATGRHGISTFMELRRIGMIPIVVAIYYSEDDIHQRSG